MSYPEAICKQDFWKTLSSIIAYGCHSISQKSPEISLPGDSTYTIIYIFLKNRLAKLQEPLMRQSPSYFSLLYNLPKLRQRILPEDNLQNH